VQLRLRPTAEFQSEDGEILIRGPTVPSAYWNNPESTRESFQDGWLRTGDLGHLDEDGFLFITGRTKELVNVGGLKVFPGEVEAVLLRFPGVLDTAVAGVSDVAGITGETLVAGIVPHSATSFDGDACARFCLSHLEKFKVPTRFVLLDVIPRAETGKIKRRELVQQLERALKQAC
jgi:acyl-CoA synthetase (AMP-forming)/AMP-acid ligase II